MVVDPDTGKVAGDILVTVGVPGIALAPGPKKGLESNGRSSTVPVFDLGKLEVTARWALPGCEEPAGLALDARRRALFAGCHNRTLVAVSCVDGHPVSKVPIGEGNDAVAADSGTGLVLASSGEGTHAVLQTVSTQKGVPHDGGRPEDARGPPPRREVRSAAVADRGAAEPEAGPDPGLVRGAGREAAPGRRGEKAPAHVRFIGTTFVSHRRVTVTPHLELAS